MTQETQTEIDIYVNSACTGNMLHRGHGGYGAIIHQEGETDLLIRGNARDTNLEKISFSAAINALTCSPHAGRIRLHTNYRFLVQKFEEEGLKELPEDDWILDQPHKSELEAEGYKSYWHLLGLAGRGRNVTYLHSDSKDETKLEREARQMAEQATQDAQDYRVFHFRGGPRNIPTKGVK